MLTAREVIGLLALLIIVFGLLQTPQAQHAVAGFIGAIGLWWLRMTR
jgi:hypothetical protein